MLRRLTLGLFSLACALAIAACSSSDTNPLSSGGVSGLGPNFATNTLYVTNSTQNAISIYPPSPAPSSSPAYQIGGSSTGLNGPLYAAFNSTKQLFVTNYNAGTQVGSVTEYQTYATGNVVPLATYSGTGTDIVQPHGIAVTSNGSLVIANVTPIGTINNELLVFAPGSIFPIVIAGSNTMLSTPWGVAVDANSDIFTANRGSGAITEYVIPSPSPTPTGSPSPTPSPTPTPTGSPSPTPSPTPFTTNVAPVSTITNANIGAPLGLALDANGNVYVTDPASKLGVPAIFVFAKGSNGASTPIATIAGSNTQLAFPTDVKVDASGIIYVVDEGLSPGSGHLLVFPAKANGNVAPTMAIPYSFGTPVGLALSP